MYILSLTVQDPDSLPEVEIARENHCHLNHQVMALAAKVKGGRGGRRGDDRRDRDRRGNGRRDDFKKGRRGNDRFDKDRRYRNKDNKNLATLQTKRKQALLFVTKETNKKKRFTL